MRPGFRKKERRNCEDVWKVILGVTTSFQKNPGVLQSHLKAGLSLAEALLTDFDQQAWAHGDAVARLGR